MAKLEVIVVGAGTGGLALAHGLRAAGIAVRVFERDYKLTDRSQGYRLNINGGGARALRSCLPASNFDRYIAASARSAPLLPSLITIAPAGVDRPTDSQAIRPGRCTADQPHRVARDFG
jgi:flavin-dependent dehydrogenase